MKKSFLQEISTKIGIRRILLPFNSQFDLKFVNFEIFSGTSSVLQRNIATKCQDYSNCVIRVEGEHILAPHSIMTNAPLCFIFSEPSSWDTLPYWNQSSGSTKHRLSKCFLVCLGRKSCVQKLPFFLHFGTELKWNFEVFLESTFWKPKTRTFDVFSSLQKSHVYKSYLFFLTLWNRIELKFSWNILLEA